MNGTFSIDRNAVFIVMLWWYCQ